MLKSHPNKALEQHLIGVKEWGKHFLTLSPCPSIQKNSDLELLEMFLLLHDIAKATMYFQKYINGQVVEEELKAHAHLSALIFLKYAMEKGKIEQYENTVKSMFFCIYKHHDQLSSISQCLDSALSERELLEKQWNSIDKEELTEVFKKIGLAPSLCTFKFEELYEGIRQLQMNWRRQIIKKDTYIKEELEAVDTLSFEEYNLIENLYSVLTNADKSEVGIGKMDLVDNVPCPIDIAQYLAKQGKEKSKLNVMRQQAFMEVQEKVKDVLDKNIYAITLPTGMGKTLNALNFSFKLKEMLEQKEHRFYKIIYALPFMSIIDQTIQVIEKILKEENINPDTDLLLKSHHIAEIEWNTGENTLEETQCTKLLMEGWNSSIIVTTFIQMFQTLIGYQNKSQRKYHQLNNAIIILDEIQSLPIKYYEAIRKVLLEFTHNSNSKFILMTATQPKILEQGEFVNLCDSQKYYLNLERTQIINEIERKLTIQNFVEEFYYQEEKTYLIILNTIQSSTEVYRLLKEKYSNKKIVLLNTNFPPIVRKASIQKIKEKQYDIVISTQLIEAGVDIDLNIVYRDLAPIPQLVQSAGRAGREGKEKGEVHIINLINDAGKQYARSIYDVTDLALTEQVLKNKQNIYEREFIDVIEAYYDLIKNPNIKSQEESLKLIKGIHLCKFSKREEEENQLRFAEDFKLIENNETMVNVFIELEEMAQALWQEYITILEQTDTIWEQQAKIEKIRRKMSEYVITIRMNKAVLDSNFPPLEKGYYYVSNNMLEFYYDTEFGFGKTETIFL